MKGRVRFVTLASVVLSAWMVAASSVEASCCLPRVVQSADWPLDTLGPAPRSDRPSVTWAGTDERGGVHALVTQAPLLWLHVSRDEGASWLPPIDLGATAATGLASAVVTPNGDVVVLFQDGRDVLARRVRNQGASLDAAVEIGASELITGLDLARTPGGVVLAAWGGKDGRGSETNGTWAATSTDDGASWGAPAELSPDDLNMDDVRAVAVEGLLAVAWTRFPSGRARTWVSRSVDEGTNWGAPVVAMPSSDSGEAFASLGFSATDRDHLQVLRRDQNRWTLEGPWLVAVSGNGGLSWEPALREECCGGDLRPFVRSDGLFLVAHRDELGGSWLRRSTGHLLPGTLEPGRDWAPDSSSAHHLAIVEDPEGGLLAAYDDYRDHDACPVPGASCESIYLARSCDDGLSWVRERLRLDRDDLGNQVHSEDPVVARSSSGLVHVLWRDERSPDREGSVIRARTLELPRPPLGRLTSSELVDADCGVTRILLEAELLDAGDCLVPRYEWLEDGVPLAGETGATLLVPPEPPGERRYTVRITCEDAPGCSADLGPLAVDVPGLPGGGVAGLSIDGPLLVTKAGDSVELAWHDTPSPAAAHSIYEGTIGTWYDHAAVACGLVRSGGDPERWMRATPAGNAYWLVVPVDCFSEGLVGGDSFGQARPLPGTGVPCGPLR